MADLTDGVPFLLAVHFHAGRDGRAVDMIVLHWMATDLAGADATFTGGGRVASATYGIEGTVIHQYVKESDASYNAADWDANMRSISIEHSAAPGRDATAATIETSTQVCLAMMQKYPAIKDRVYPHSKFTATACPGTLPWQAIRDEALRRYDGGAAPQPPTQPEEFMATMSDANQQKLLDAANEMLAFKNYWRHMYNNSEWNHTILDRLGPQIAALTVAMAAVQADPNLDTAALSKIFSDALAAQVSVTGELHVEPKPLA